MNIENIIREIYTKGYEGSIESIEDIVKEYSLKLKEQMTPEVEQHPYVDENEEEHRYEWQETMRRQRQRLEDYDLQCKLNYAEKLKQVIAQQNQIAQQKAQQNLNKNPPSSAIWEKGRDGHGMALLPRRGY